MIFSVTLVHHDPFWNSKELSLRIRTCLWMKPIADLTCPFFRFVLILTPRVSHGNNTWYTPENSRPGTPKSWRFGSDDFPYQLGDFQVNHEKSSGGAVSKLRHYPFFQPGFYRERVRPLISALESRMLNANFTIKDCISLLHWIRLPRSKIVVPWWLVRVILFQSRCDEEWKGWGGLFSQWFLKNSKNLGAL